MALVGSNLFRRILRWKYTLYTQVVSLEPWGTKKRFGYRLQSSCFRVLISCRQQYKGLCAIRGTFRGLLFGAVSRGGRCLHDDQRMKTTIRSNTIRSLFAIRSLFESSSNRNILLTYLFFIFSCCLLFHEDDLLSPAHAVVSGRSHPSG